jgi:hypothetical protein
MRLQLILAGMFATLSMAAVSLGGNPCGSDGQELGGLE